MTTGEPFPTGPFKGKRRAGLRLFSKPLRHIILESLALQGASSACRFSPCLWIIARHQSPCLI